MYTRLVCVYDLAVFPIHKIPLAIWQGLVIALQPMQVKIHFDQFSCQIWCTSTRVKQASAEI